MSLFVGNIAGEISQKELEDLFNKYGKCEIKHKNIFAFVEYSSDKEAEQAKQELNKKEINGRVLSIEWSKKSKNYASKRYRDSGRCYTCGRRGHFARDCPERRSDSYHRYRDRSYRSRSRSGKYRSRREIINIEDDHGVENEVMIVIIMIEIDIGIDIDIKIDIEDQEVEIVGIVGIVEIADINRTIV